MTPEKLAAEVEQLFTLPELYFKLRQILDAPQSTVEDVAGLLAQDPNLSARILRLVNSAFFGFATEIDSITRAVNIMGFAQIHDLVLTVSTINAFHQVDRHLIDMKSFWINSLMTATLAKLMARQCNIVDTDRLFVSGILHDVGHLVLYSQLPSYSEQLLTRAKDEQIAIGVLEQQTYGFDYAQVGGALLQRWKLPSCFHESISRHTHVDGEQPYAVESAILQLATAMVAEDTAKKTGFPALAIQPICWTLTLLEPEQLPPIKAEAKKNMAQVLTLLFA